MNKIDPDGKTDRKRIPETRDVVENAKK